MMHGINSLKPPLGLKIFSQILGKVLLWSLFLFFILRLEFLIWNFSQFKNASLAQILYAFILGIRFDLSASLLLLSPWLLFCLFTSLLVSLGVLSFDLLKRVWILLWILFLICTLPIWIFNIFDIELVNFVGRRVTTSSIFLLREFQGGATKSVIVPYLLALISQLLLLALYYQKIWKSWKTLPGFGQEQQRFHRLLSWTLTSLLIISVAVIGIRGGLQKKPLNFVHSNVFVTPFLNNLVLNSSFTILKTLQKSSLAREKYFENSEELLSLLNAHSEKGSLLEGRRPQRSPNFVIIILESFAKEYMGKVNGVAGFTPFLDELAEKSLFFPNAFANGRRSIEGIAAIYSGIPALMSEPFISSEFSSNYFLGLGTLLKSKGYHSSFFHGAENGSMYFDTFMKSAGVDHYYGLNEYPHPEDTDGAWGIYDEPFFQFFAQKLDQFPQPFSAGIFSLSSHPPYTLPAKYKDQFKPGPLEIAASIQYTDWSLRKFFETAQTKPWFKNTIFIITADHTQKSYLPQYDNILGHYRVPLLIYAPSYHWPKVDTQALVQHIDILPTIMDILDLKNQEHVQLGRSVFTPGEKTISIYLEPGYLLVAPETWSLWDPPENPRHYLWEDWGQKSPIMNFAKTEHLEKRLKASVQYFSEGLWDQRFYFPVRK